MACRHSHHLDGVCDHQTDRGQEMSLFKYIDLDKVTCLNANHPDAVKNIFKPWDQRKSLEKPALESDVDEELIIFIPFTNGVVQLKSISLWTNDLEQAPNKMKVVFNYYSRKIINRDDVDFEIVEQVEAAQEFDLIQHSEVVEYPTRMSRFHNVHSLTIYFPSNFTNDETTKLNYLGLKGEYKEVKKDIIMTTVYELNANPADHPKAKSDMMNTYQMGL